MAVFATKSAAVSTAVGRIGLREHAHISARKKSGSSTHDRKGECKMRKFFKAFAMLALMAGICGLRPAEAAAATKHYVVTNNDVSGPNTVTLYLAGGTASAPKLSRLQTIKTGGAGLGGGYFGLVRQVLVGEGKGECVFDADGGSNDVAAILLQTKQVVGNYKGSGTDNAGNPGI